MPNVAEATIPITLRLSIDLRRALVEEADRREMHFSEVIREALWEHFERAQQARILAP